MELTQNQAILAVTVTNSFLMEYQKDNLFKNCYMLALVNWTKVTKEIVMLLEKNDNIWQQMNNFTSFQDQIGYCYSIGLLANNDVLSIQRTIQEYKENGYILICNSELQIRTHLRLSSDCDTITIIK